MASQRPYTISHPSAFEFEAVLRQAGISRDAPRAARQRELELGVQANHRAPETLARPPHPTDADDLEDEDPVPGGRDMIWTEANPRALAFEMLTLDSRVPLPLKRQSNPFLQENGEADGSDEVKMRVHQIAMKAMPHMNLQPIPGQSQNPEVKQHLANEKLEAEKNEREWKEAQSRVLSETWESHCAKSESMSKDYEERVERRAKCNDILNFLPNKDKARMDEFDVKLKTLVPNERTRRRLRSDLVNLQKYWANDLKPGATLLTRQIPDFHYRIRKFHTLRILFLEDLRHLVIVRREMKPAGLTALSIWDDRLWRKPDPQNEDAFMKSQNRIQYTLDLVRLCWEDVIEEIELEATPEIDDMDRDYGYTNMTQNHSEIADLGVKLMVKEMENAPEHDIEQLLRYAVVQYISADSEDDMQMREALFIIWEIIMVSGMYYREPQSTRKCSCTGRLLLTKRIREWGINPRYKSFFSGACLLDYDKIKDMRSKPKFQYTIPEGEATEFQSVCFGKYPEVEHPVWMCVRMHLALELVRSTHLCIKNNHHNCHAHQRERAEAIVRGIYGVQKLWEDHPYHKHWNVVIEQMTDAINEGGEEWYFIQRIKQIGNSLLKLDRMWLELQKRQLPQTNGGGISPKAVKLLGMDSKNKAKEAAAANAMLRFKGKMLQYKQENIKAIYGPPHKDSDHIRPETLTRRTGSQTELKSAVPPSPQTSLHTFDLGGPSGGHNSAANAAKDFLKKLKPSLSLSKKKSPPPAMKISAPIMITEEDEEQSMPPPVPTKSFPTSGTDRGNAAPSGPSMPLGHATASGFQPRPTHRMPQPFSDDDEEYNSGVAGGSYHESDDRDSLGALGGTSTGQHAHHQQEEESNNGPSGSGGASRKKKKGKGRGKRN